MYVKLIIKIIIKQIIHIYIYTTPYLPTTTERHIKQNMNT